jgi:hypothetical protein
MRRLKVHAFSSVDALIDSIHPEAAAMALKGTIGVQNIPGWNKIPGLKELGKNAQIGYLLAVLTPFDYASGGKLHLSLKPLDSTIFISISAGKKQLILTGKLKDFTFEAGTPIKNVPLGGGKAILFSNWRLGGTPSGPAGAGSVNGGVLIRVASAGPVVAAAKKVVTLGTRALEI